MDNPLEEVEQSDFVVWLEHNQLKFTAVPNSTWTKSWNQKRKNNATGLRKGFPDMVVIISPAVSKDGEGYFLCVEMKRRRLSTLSVEQKEWRDAINGLNLPNVQSYVAKGSDEAITIVSHYLKNPRSVEAF